MREFDKLARENNPLVAKKADYWAQARYHYRNGASPADAAALVARKAPPKKAPPPPPAAQPPSLVGFAGACPGAQRRCVFRCFRGGIPWAAPGKGHERCLVVIPKLASAQCVREG